MAPEPVHSWVAQAGLFLPADGLRLLGQHDGGGQAGRGFLVGRADGEIIALPLLPYLIMASIAEGAVDGGWSAEQIGARVGLATGQGLTADTVRYLVAGKLAPHGLLAAAGPDQLNPAADGRRDRSTGPRGRAVADLLRPAWAPGARRPTWTAGPADRVLAWPIAARLERLLLPHRRRRWALALGVSGMLVCVAATAPIMAETSDGATGQPGSAAAAASAAAAPQSASGPASSAAATVSRRQAAAWVAAQVSPDVTVWCDPGTSRQLRQDGFPAGRLSALPPGARAFPGPGIVVATAAVRSQFGPRLAAAWAPQVIASFGTGSARIDVRVIAPSGPAAFRAQLAAEQAALASAGRQLLANANLRPSPSARAALAAGQVDARLLTILALLAAQRPVRLTAFAAAPGAGPGVPLRAAELGLDSTAAQTAVVDLLHAQRGAYRPAAVTVNGAGDQAAVTVRFDAPAAMNISQP
jgi:hypothetical protein